MTDLRPVPGFPGVFVTPGGEVYQQLATSPSDGGYATVKLGRMTVRRHLLAALAFLGPPAGERHQVRHLDGDPGNDGPKNLAWGTPTENYADSVRHGTATRGERNGAAKLTLAEAQQLYDRRREGEAGRALALEFGISEQAVCDLLAGRTWPEVNRWAEPIY